jgi:hypothetical protein
MTSVKITDLTAYTDAASTDVLPIVDVGADVTKKIAIGDIVKAVPQGTAALPGLAFDGDPNTGVYSPGADQVAISTNGTGRLFVDSTGNVGIGTSSPDSALTVGTLSGGAPTVRGDIIINHVGGGASLTTKGGLEFKVDGNNNGYGARLLSAFNGVSAYNFAIQTRNNSTSWSTPLLIDSAGNVGIGTTDTNSLFSSGRNVKLSNTSGKVSYEAIVLDGTNNHRVGLFVDNGTGDLGLDTGSTSATYNGLSFYIEGSKKATIDRAGRLLVGTSSARSNVDFQFGSDTPKQQLEVANAGLGALIVQNYDSATLGAPAYLTLARAGSSAIGSTTIVADGNYLGEIDFSGSDGTDFTVAAFIRGEVDGTPGANDMPGRLVFSTTADGASSPTERMRITKDGYITLDGSTSAVGMRIGSAGQLLLIADNGGLYHQAGGNYYLVTTAGGSTSDATLKTNVQPIANSLDKLSQIRGVTFAFIEEPLCDADKGQQIGVIAQEVEAVFPEAVVTGGDGIKAVRYDKLVAPLIEALKESKARIETLEAKVAALEGV